MRFRRCESSRRQGQVIERGTLVLRDGFIEAVQVPDVTVPADAQVIPAEDGWTVYAAFIDAASAVGLEATPEGATAGAGSRRRKTERRGCHRTN